MSVTFIPRSALNEKRHHIYFFYTVVDYKSTQLFLSITYVLYIDLYIYNTNMLEFKLKNTPSIYIFYILYFL